MRRCHQPSTGPGRPWDHCPAASLDRREGGARRPHGRAREAFSVLRFRFTSGIRDARAHFRAPPSWSLAGAPVDVRPRPRPPRRVESGVTSIMASKRDALVASAEKSLAKGKVDSALKDYQKVLEEIPGDVNILNKVGDLLTRLNRNEEAIPYFTKIAEHFARDGFFLRGIAIYKKINRLDP